MAYQTIPPSGTSDPWNVVSIPANTDTVDITSLNGDVDIGYTIEFQFNCNALGQLELRPNALTTNLRAWGGYSAAGAAWNAFGGSNGIFAGSGSAGVITGTVSVVARTGQYRQFNVEVTDSSFTGGIYCPIQWQETSTNLTSIRFKATNAASILTSGSYCRWRVS